MAATPESKVKNRVKMVLGKHSAYTVMPVTGGYGKSGPPDFLACIGGKFIGIECKANGNKPTALQMKNLADIATAGGYAFIVDDKSVGVFILALDNVVNNRAKPAVMDLTYEEGAN
jgi:hypothetical protein